MNTKQTQQGLLLAGLVVVMIAVYAWALRRPAPADTPQPPAAVAGQAEPVPTGNRPAPTPSPAPSGRGLANEAAQRDAQRARAMRLGWGHDPFTRAEPRQVTNFTLSGILWDATRPLAIINGRTLYIGDEVADGYRLVNISPDSVSITDGTKSYELHVAP